MIFNRKNLLRTAIKLATASCFMAVGSMTALAQEAEEEGSSSLEEVIVTARKREENVMDVPVSVNVVTADMMAAANIIDINDLAAKTPGLKFNSGFGRQGDRPVIRGISSIFTAEELVGYFVDGVYVSGSIQSFDLTSMERVEVIKGPQSATFGRRTFAGAINYVTAHPKEKLEIDAKATLGTNDLVDLSATLGGRTSDKFGYRLSARSYNYGGDFKNAKVGGPPVGGQETLSANLGLFFYPSEATTIQLNFNYSKDDDEQYAISMFRRADLNICRDDVTRPYHCGTIPGDIQPNLGASFMDNKDYGVERTRKRSFIKLDHEMDWALFSFTGSYNKTDTYAGQDQTFLGLDTVFSFATFGQTPAIEWHSMDDTETTDSSLEAWLRGDAMDGNLTWGVGAYHYDESNDNVSRNGDGSLESINSLDVQNTAVMALAEYSFNDAFKLGGEIRYADDDITDNEFSNNWTSTTYRVTGTWNYSDNGMAYISYSTGVLPGGFNTDARLPENLKFIDQQGMKNFEIGMKSTFSEKLILTAAIFDMEWTDQVRSEFWFDADGFPVGYRSNQGTSDIRGLEFNAMWYPTEQLHFVLGGSFVDTKIKDFISDDATDIDWSDNKDGDVSGNKMPLSPEKEVYLAGNYTHPIGDNLELVTRVDYAYQGKRYVRTINWADTGSESLLGAQVSLVSDNWSLMLWGKNLTNEDSAISALRYLEANSFFYGGRSFAVTPRPGAEYGLTFRYNY